MGQASAIIGDSTMLIEIKRKLSMKPVMTGLVRCVLLAVSLAAMGATCAAQAGVPVPQDSPLYQSFALLKTVQAYRMNINRQPNDPRGTKGDAMGMDFGAIEKSVENDTTQVVIRMKMPAMDLPGTMDEWEIRAVAVNGRVARMFSSPAIARLNKLNQQKMAMQMAMLDKQASIAIAHALTQGPLGAISAGMAAGQNALMQAEAPRKLHEEKTFYSWKCLETPADSASKKTPIQLTDFKAMGDESVGATLTAVYEFYANDGSGPHGPVKLYVAKDGKDVGFPVRIHLDDRQGHGSMDMDYSYGPFHEIEVPECLGGQ